MTSTSLSGKTVLVVGGGSGIGRQIAADLVREGAEVVLAGRHPERLRESASRLAARTVRLDLADEDSIVAAAHGLGGVDHVVSLGADHANGPVAGLRREGIVAAFDAKVVGPLMLAKHLAPVMREGGSFLFFSGVAAWKPAPGLAVMATTNGAVAVLAEALAVELAPLRVNALSPGIVDSGAWDSMGEGKATFLTDTAESLPVGRVGAPEDVSAAALMVLGNGFMTGTTLHVDGGGRIA